MKKNGKSIFVVYAAVAAFLSLLVKSFVLFAALIGIYLIANYVRQIEWEPKKESSKNPAPVSRVSSSAQIPVRIPQQPIMDLNEIRDKWIRQYIAFDVETTGFDTVNDRMVEYSAVLFENGNPTGTCTSLVRTDVRSNPGAQEVHGITEEMLADAPDEKDAVAKLVSFLGNALSGDTPIVCHYAEFDLGFLTNALIRLGLATPDMKVRYIDTMQLSRRYLDPKYTPNLANHKLGTLKEIFGVQEVAHRAEGDAVACGTILSMFPDKVMEQQSKIDAIVSKRTPTPLQMDFCAVLRDIFGQTGNDTSCLKFLKAPGGVNVNNFWNFFSLSFIKNAVSAVVPQTVAESSGLPYDDVSLDPQSKDLRRIYLTSPADLYKISEHLAQIFEEVVLKTERYSRQGERQRERLEEYEYDPASGRSIGKAEMQQILLRIESADYSGITVPVKEPVYDRADIQISPTVVLKPITPVRMTEASKQKLDVTIENAESFRKDGNFQAGADLLLKSRSKGHITPLLYETLAKIYHSAKEYDNEIAVLDEGIEMCDFGIRTLERRRDDATKSLLAVQNKK